MAGKGDKPRIGDRKAFNKNHDVIKFPDKNLPNGFVKIKGKLIKKY